MAMQQCSPIAMRGPGAALRPCGGGAVRFSRPHALVRPQRSVERTRQAAEAARWRAAAADGDSGSAAAASSAPSGSGAAEEPETVYYEGSGAPAELAISLLLGAFIITLPLTISSIGRRLWIKYKFTNKRVVVTTNSPLLKREVQVEYKQIREIRAASRGLGLWGDIVIFLKDGSRLELAGLERHQELVEYMERQAGL